MTGHTPCTLLVRWPHCHVAFFKKYFSRMVDATVAYSSAPLYRHYFLGGALPLLSRCSKCLSWKTSTLSRRWWRLQCLQPISQQHLSPVTQVIQKTEEKASGRVCLSWAWNLHTRRDCLWELFAGCWWWVRSYHPTRCKPLLAVVNCCQKCGQPSATIALAAVNLNHSAVMFSFSAYKHTSSQRSEHT